jgi:hypothetical protein
LIYVDASEFELFGVQRADENTDSAYRRRPIAFLRRNLGKALPYAFRYLLIISLGY